MMDSSGMMTRSRSRNTTILQQDHPAGSNDQSDISGEEDHLHAQGIESLTDSSDEMFSFATTCVLNSISKSNTAQEEATHNITFIFDFLNGFEQDHIEMQPRIAAWRQSMYKSAGNNDIFKRIYWAGETKRRIQRYEDRLQQAWPTPSANIISTTTTKKTRSKHMLQLLAHLSEKVSKVGGMRLLNDARQRRLSERGITARGFSQKPQLVTIDVKSAVNNLKGSNVNGPDHHGNQQGKRKRASGEDGSDRASSAAMDDTQENLASVGVGANDASNDQNSGVALEDPESEGQTAMGQDSGHSVQGVDEDDDHASLTEISEEDASVALYAASWRDFADNNRCKASSKPEAKFYRTLRLQIQSYTTRTACFTTVRELSYLMIPTSTIYSRLQITSCQKSVDLITQSWALTKDWWWKILTQSIPRSS